MLDSVLRVALGESNLLCAFVIFYEVHSKLGSSETSECKFCFSLLCARYFQLFVVIKLLIALGL